VWGIPTDHFDPDGARNEALARARKTARPLSELLVERSHINRGALKHRLYKEGLKRPVCELCGQGEIWRGRPMSLILDHVNGRRDDNRLENLRIVCPNCNATLDTHCGRAARLRPPEVPCERCGVLYRPQHSRQRFCSRACGQRAKRPYRARPDERRCERPPYEELLAEVAELGWSGTGRKHGVSDNAIRKWVRWYERSGEVGGRAA
jgi:hypothetical protein